MFFKLPITEVSNVDDHTRVSSSRQAIFMVLDLCTAFALGITSKGWFKYLYKEE